MKGNLAQVLLPESPQYLWSKGYFVEAESVLQKFSNSRQKKLPVGLLRRVTECHSAIDMTNRHTITKSILKLQANKKTESYRKYENSLNFCLE